MTNPSFFFGIFKKLQVCEPGILYRTSPFGGAGHFTPTNMANSPTGGLSGGVTLAHPSDPNGILGKVLECSSAIPSLVGQYPLAQGSTVPDNTPLYMMLYTCMTNPNPPVVGGFGSTPPVGMPPLQWPVMPFGDLSINLAWQEFVVMAPAGSTLVDALGSWIMNGQVNDEPQSGPLYYPTLTQSLPAKVPNLQSETSNLFVCSMAGDDGRRPSDTPPGPAIPAHYWATSQIFLTDSNGVPQTPMRLESGSEYYVVAAIGNSGNITAGRLPPAIPAATQPIEVECYAMAFNTSWSPPVQLPPLSNLDVADPNMTYEQYSLAYEFYDVVGFRFNVDSVFTALAQALEAAHMNMGQLAAEDWVRNSHPCVKVLIVNGEIANGQSPPNPKPPSPTTSNPQTDRHIAQKNLAHFEILTIERRQVIWWNFVVAQAPAATPGLNRLQIRAELPPDAFEFLLALPTQPFADYVRKEGGIEGFEVVRDASSKPFPDAVILRETRRGSLLEVAAHRREPFLGFSFGIEYDSTRLKPGAVGSVSLVQLAPEEVVGGFTIDVTMAGRGT